MKLENRFVGDDFRSGRLNHEKKDINTDFPTLQDVGKGRETLFSKRQPETKVIESF